MNFFKHLQGLKTDELMGIAFEYVLTHKLVVAGCILGLIILIYCIKVPLHRKRYMTSLNIIKRDYLDLNTNTNVYKGKYTYQQYEGIRLFRSAWYTKEQQEIDIARSDYVPQKIGASEE